MTPGFAKPRSEMPWLPYESLDRVIINAHNFPAPSGGFTPIATESAAWVPSLDTAGNGTATLTDLVGGVDGTLSHATPATAWQADSGSGGVRRIDFGGSDQITTAFDCSGSGLLCVAGWFKTASTAGANSNPIISAGENASGSQLSIAIENGQFYCRFVGNLARCGAASLNDGAWHNFVFVKPSLATTSGILIWVDGVSQTVITTGSTVLNFSAANAIQIGSRDFSGAAYFDGSLDDIRIDQTTQWGSTEVALFASQRAYQ